MFSRSCLVFLAFAAALSVSLLSSTPAHAASTPSAIATAPTNVHIGVGSVTFRMSHDTVTIQLYGVGVVYVRVQRDGVDDQPTLVMDPNPVAQFNGHPDAYRQANDVSLVGDELRAIWHQATNTLELEDTQQHPLLQLNLAALMHGKVQLTHAANDALYGIHSYSKDDDASAGLLRSGTQVAKAGEQGQAGAPFVWSTAGYGVLVDSNGANFTLQPGQIEIDGLSKPTMDVYLLVGDPPQLFNELANLSGHAPLFPKWSLGFINSQWGIDEEQFRQIIATYRRKHIPLDAFTFDFDWKAWDEEWGEFRWNAKKFPDGPSGKLKSDMDKLGVHMTGIMKPRVHVNTIEGRYATAHDLWLPNEKISDDYFSHQPVKDLDFDKPATRAWFFNNALEHSFDTGIVGWWNDEADTTKSNTQFLNMQRSIYDGQRAISNQRVWSINRDFWLGAQRYAYGLWSGDIDTGFKSMAAQRPRMLSAINLGEMQWGMDGGGFKGRPSDENYARWIEFGAFTPIFRVHGTFGQKRQPWLYGLVAENAATKAIRLRYTLIPYIYAYQQQAHAHGVGLVRPLAFAWPKDAKVRNDTSAWLFGQWLLVSPVVQQGQSIKHIYLPHGSWTDWFTGKVYTGGQTINVPVDSATWSDIPLFIRAGAIIPTQPVMDYIGQYPVTQQAIDIFPSQARTQFSYYDDDGRTYDYEKGAYFAQTLTVQKRAGSVDVMLSMVNGSFKPQLQHYLLKVHGITARAVSAIDQPMQSAGSLDALRRQSGEGWASGHDRYGAVTWIKCIAGVATSIHLSARSAESPRVHP